MSAAYMLLGHPLGHSLSPLIHRALFRRRGADATYTLCDLDEAALQAAAPTLTRYAGYNVTIPYKTAIIPLLDGLDDSARRCGAVNCVKVQNGRQTGYNTDCVGFLHSVRQFRLDGRVLLLGCGGAGRMMATEAAAKGAELTIAVRTKSLPRALALAEALRRAYPQASIQARALDALDGIYDLLLNATPVGMFPHGDDRPVPEAVTARCAAVFDAIYNPARTLLLQDADKHGIPAVGGMEMLVRQACCAHTIWYGATFSDAEIMEVCAIAQAQLTEAMPAN